MLSCCRPLEHRHGYIVCCCRGGTAQSCRANGTLQAALLRPAPNMGLSLGRRFTLAWARAALVAGVVRMLRDRQEPCSQHAWKTSQCMACAAAAACLAVLSAEQLSAGIWLLAAAAARLACSAAGSHRRRQSLFSSLLVQGSLSTGSLHLGSIWQHRDCQVLPSTGSAWNHTHHVHHRARLSKCQPAPLHIPCIASHRLKLYRLKL